MATIVRGKNPRKPWTVRYSYDGHQRERSFATKREATEFLVKFEHDSRELSFVDPKMANEKFGLVAQRWLARHPGSPKTHRVYDSVLRIHILPVFGSKGLAAVAADREGVERFLRETLPGKGLGASVVRTCYLVISAVVNDAIKAGRIRETRLRGITLPAVAQKANLVFATPHQIEALAKELPDPFSFTIYLMRGCGLRLGEALGVLPGDIKDGRLRLARQLAPNGKSHLPLKHRGRDDYRDIPIPQFVLDARPRNFQGFPPCSHRAYSAWFNRARDRAGIGKHFTPHSLRHQFASACLAGGIPITDVSKWLGHRNIQTTFGIYGHLVPASWDRVRGVLDEEWSS
jgi:integrase